MDTLAQLGDELRFVLITSAAQILPISEASEAVNTDVEGLAVHVAKVEHEKCDRCWHRREEVGHIEAHPTLCQRCVDNVDGEEKYVTLHKYALSKTIV